MRNLIFFSSLIVSLILLANTNAQTLQQYCNYQATLNNRFSTQYIGDINNQRCSFCQFSDNMQTNGVDNFQNGCSSCPDYTTGTCSTCKANYVKTQSKLCLPCANQGQTCCAGNDPLQDTYYRISVNGANPNTQNGLQTIFQSLQTYTGLRQITCQKGYFALGHVCIKLPATCAQITVKDNWYYCTQCIAGFYFDSNNQCVKNCKATYISNQGQINENQPCSSCASDSKCLACDNTNGYYYFDNASSQQVKGEDTSGTSKGTIQFCKQCPQNCIDCSGGEKTCNKCQPYYFLQGNTCTRCPTPTKYVKLNRNVPIKSYYSTCIDDKDDINSYRWNTSLTVTTDGPDTLGEKIERPIILLNDNLYTSCESNCIQCSPNADNSASKCTQCINGYYLDSTNVDAPQCRICPANSVLCAWYANFNKPRVIACSMNNSLNPPIFLSFLLYKTADTYDPDQQCVQNNNRCKTMIDSDLSKVGICQSCYSADDIAATSGLSRINYALTGSGICKQCSTGTKECGPNPNQQSGVVSLSCIDGYTLTPQSACVKCPSNCLTCDSNNKCLTCDPSNYYTKLDDNGNIVDCEQPKAYSISSAPRDGCINWGMGTNQQQNPSCVACGTGYVLVKSIELTIRNQTFENLSLCMACPENCTSCGTGTNRATCSACAAGYYLSNNVCLKYPEGCASFNGSKCTYCKYGYRLVNDQWCSLCTSGTVSFTGGEWFDCPGAQCINGSSDEPVSPSSSSSPATNSTILSITSLCLLIVILLI